MSLNQIVLNSQLLSSLYGQVLVETSTADGPRSTDEASEIKSPAVVEAQPVSRPMPAAEEKAEPKPVVSIPEAKIPVRESETPAPAPTANQKPETRNPKLLGNNGRHVLILVNHPSLPIIPDGELAFLSNILSACRLSLADVAITNVAGMDGTAISGLMDSLQAKSVLLFGITPLEAGLPLNFPHFQLQAFNKRTYLHSPVLPDLENDKVLKGKLWASLRNLFSI
jgi:hypothetical protein